MSKPKLDNYLKDRFSKLSTNEKYKLLFPTNKKTEPKSVILYRSEEHYFTNIYKLSNEMAKPLTTDQTNEIIRGGHWLITFTGKTKRIDPKLDKGCSHCGAEWHNYSWCK